MKLTHYLNYPVCLNQTQKKVLVLVLGTWAINFILFDKPLSYLLYKVMLLDPVAPVHHDRVKTCRETSAARPWSHVLSKIWLLPLCWSNLLGPYSLTGFCDKSPQAHSEWIFYFSLVLDCKHNRRTQVRSLLPFRKVWKVLTRITLPPSFGTWRKHCSGPQMNVPGKKNNIRSLVDVGFSAFILAECWYFHVF